MPQQGKRVFNIDPPAFPNAIMRRAKTLPRREQWARQAPTESLTPIPELENSLGYKRRIGSLQMTSALALTADVNGRKADTLPFRIQNVVIWPRH